MVQRVFSLIFILISNFSIAWSFTKLTPGPALTINANDTVFFNLSTAVISNSYIDIPVSIISDDVINALDFSFKFNEAYLTYDTIISYKSYLFALASFNQSDRILRFTSSSLSPIEHNIPLLIIRFRLTDACRKTLQADFNTIKTYLNGDPSSYKLPPAFNYSIQANFADSNSCFLSNTLFSDRSLANGTNISSWRWNFGNGDTSNIINPVTSYAGVGNYSVTLIVTSGTGCKDTITKLVVVNPVPLINFAYQTNCQTGSVVFSDSSTIASGTINGWMWNFGDASTSGLQHPTHTYTFGGGNYTVSLTAVSDSGCAAMDTSTIFVDTPTARFGAAGGCVGATINFSDSSTTTSGLISNWHWEFGDGDTSVIQNPSHSYSNAGTYTVTLVATTDQGCSNSVTEILTIEGKPALKFSGDNLSGCLPLTVNFSDSSTTSLGSLYLWSFGNTDTSSLINPIQTYQDTGTFTVKLVIMTSGGCTDSLIKSSYIKVYGNPIAKFGAPNGCVGSAINLSDSSATTSGTINSWNWNFGEGGTSSIQHPSNIFSNAGTYTVNLIVTTDLGCTDSLTKSLTIEDKPVVSFEGDNVSGCAPLSVNFSDSSITTSNSSYFWSFGDAEVSFLKDASHTYLSNGIFTVKHIVTTAAGCSDSLVKTSFITVTSPTVSFISSSNTLILPEAVVTFTNLSSGFNNILWNFGDSTFSNQKNPQHKYTEEGTYRVCLTMQDTAGCSATHCDTVTVLIVYPIAIPKAFTPNGDNVNDILRVRGGPLSEMDLRLFNEWGNQVFISNEQNVGWDGSFKGTPQPQGLYVYTLTGKTVDNTTINIHGIVNLVR